MLNIPISTQLELFVEQQAIKAGFSTASDYVLHLIQKEQQLLSLSGDDSVSADRETDPILLMRLPLADRRQALAVQAEGMAAHYEQNNDWREFTTGDFIDY